MSRSITARTYAEPSELQIHIAVAQHLKHRARKGVLWFHPANEGKRSKAEGGKLKAMGLAAGVPDLIIVADGKTYGLELEENPGPSFPDQKYMIERFEQAGAFTAVAYGLDAAISILTAWGIIPGQRMARAA